MANLKVSEMTEATMFDDNDYTMIVQSNQSKKISKENMLGGIEENIDDIEGNIGDLSNLTTPTVSNLVGAINSVVESGSNENGNYIKYADGTMICTKQITTVTRISTTFGNLYENSTKIQFGNFASTFTQIPLVFGYCVGRTAILEAIQNTTISDWGGTWLMRPNADTTDQTYTVNLFAIGKWK